MDISPTVAAIYFEGDSHITFDFQNGDGAKTITVTGDGSEHGTGNIQLNLTLTHATEWTTQTTGDGVSTIHSTNGGLIITGKGDIANIDIAANTKLDLAKNFDANGRALGLTVAGELDAQHTILSGKDTTTSSSAAINGKLSAGELIIGSIGVVSFASAGLTVATDIKLGNQSSLTVPAGGIVTSSGIIHIGDFLGEAPGLASGGGATVTISGTFGYTPLVPFTPDLTISGGYSTQFTVVGGTVGVGHLEVGNTSVAGAYQPVLDVASGHVYANWADVGLGDASHVSGKLLVESAGTVDVASSLDVFEEIKPRVIATLLGTTITVPTEPSLLLEVDGTLNVDTASLGTSIGPNVGAKILVKGTFTAKGRGTAITIGDGSWYTPTIITINGGLIQSVGVPLPAFPGVPVPPGDIFKKVGAVVITVFGGSISGPVVPLGTHGDLLPGDGLNFDDFGNFIGNPYATDPFGTLTIDGDLDASAGFTLDSVLDPSGNSNKLVVTGTASFGGDLLDQFRAFSTSGTGSTFEHAGYSFNILTAGSITGGFTIPTFNVGAGYGYSNEVAYTWGSPIPAAIASADLPALAPGLVWTLNKVHNSAANTDSLVLAVADPTPVIADVNPTTDAPFNSFRYYAVKFRALPTSAAVTSVNNAFVLQAEGRVDLQDGNGMHLPAANATIGNWNTVSGVNFTSTPDADGYYYATAMLEVGSTYKLRVVANTAEGQFVSAANTYAAPLPTMTNIGLGLAFYNSNTPILTCNSGYSIRFSQYGQYAWIRSAGNVFGDEWYDVNDTTVGYNAALATYYNQAGKPSEFLVEWQSNTDPAVTGYATLTSTGTATPFATAVGNADYTILPYEYAYGEADGGGENGNYKFPGMEVRHAPRRAA